MESSSAPRCVGGALVPFREPRNNNIRSVKWSPDGLCLLTASEDKNLRLFELPDEAQIAAAAPHDEEDTDVPSHNWFSGSLV